MIKFNLQFFGGRGGSSSGGKNSMLASLTDNMDFRAWVRENMSNPEFKQFGRENHIDAVRDLWYEKRASVELQNVHEMPIEDALDQVRDAIPASHQERWFREANSDIKPHLVNDILSNPGTLNAGLNVAYNNYKYDVEIQNIRNGTNTAPLSFNRWLTTPQTMYRGEHGQQHVQSDIFHSYTRDRSIAAKFGDQISTIRIRPIDTWGSYQTTAEQEFLVPARRLRG